MWLSHPDFSRIVNEAWHDNEECLTDAITSFSSLAMVWNKEVFGNIFEKKKKKAYVSIIAYLESFGYSAFSKSSSFSGT